MSHKKLGIATGAAVVVTGVAVGAAFASIGWKHHQTKHVGGSIHAVVIDEDAGDVRVTSEARSDVLVRSTTSWVFHKPHLTTKVENGVLRIETHGHGFLSGTDYRVAVPNGLAVSVKTDAGNISVDALARRISVKTDAGDVHVKVPAGRYAVEANTDAGDTHVRGLVRDDTAPRSISARTDAGNVTVEAR
jgi:DUF4097 and DUF4098 domain-containing protein YvlB